MNFLELKNEMKRYLYLLLIPFLASCNSNKPEIKDVLSNYLKYDKTYDENTFKVKKIDALNERKDDFVLGHRMGILGCSTAEMKMSLGC